MKQLIVHIIAKEMECFSTKTANMSPFSSRCDRIPLSFYNAKKAMFT